MTVVWRIFARFFLHLAVRPRRRGWHRLADWSEGLAEKFFRRVKGARG